MMDVPGANRSPRGQVFGTLLTSAFPVLVVSVASQRQVQLPMRHHRALYNSLPTQRANAPVCNCSRF